MSNKLYHFILGLIALIGIIGLLKVNHSMNTLAQDATFRESVRMMDRQDAQKQFGGRE